MMKLDLHVHTIASSDSLLDFGDLVSICRSRGLDGVAVCDHNTIRGALEARRICADNDILVIIGQEINTAQGEVVGLFLSEEIPQGLSVSDTVAAIQEQGGLVYVPHPFDRFRARVIQPKALNSIVDRIDIVEVLNARSWTAHGDRKARAFAARYHLPMGGGSDAHSPHEVGNARVVMEPFETPEEFLHSLRTAHIEGRRTSPFLRLWLKLVRLSRRM